MVSVFNKGGDDIFYRIVGKLNLYILFEGDPLVEEKTPEQESLHLSKSWTLRNLPLRLNQYGRWCLFGELHRLSEKQR